MHHLTTLESCPINTKTTRTQHFHRALPKHSVHFIRNWMAYFLLVRFLNSCEINRTACIENEKYSQVCLKCVDWNRFLELNIFSIGGKVRPKKNLIMKECGRAEAAGYVGRDGWTGGAWESWGCVARWPIHHSPDRRALIYSPAWNLNRTEISLLI